MKRNAMPAAPRHLGPELTIPFAAEHHIALLALLAEGGDLQLDLSSVSDFDSSGVQLLLSLQRTLVERGDALQLVAVSPAVQDGLTLFGLSELLALH
jgi:anti-sigma B factor antagonist